MAMQFREPNSEFVPGGMKHGAFTREDGTWAPSTKMLDFIDCVKFGILLSHEKSNSTVMDVPDDPHDTIKPFNEELVNDARRGKFPMQPATAKNKCVTLLSSFHGSYFRNVPSMD